LNSQYFVVVIRKLQKRSTGDYVCQGDCDDGDVKPNIGVTTWPPQAWMSYTPYSGKFQIEENCPLAMGCGRIQRRAIAALGSRHSLTRAHSRGGAGARLPIPHPLPCHVGKASKHDSSSPFLSSRDHLCLRGEPIMAPQPVFDSDQIRDKARRDLLYLLEGVSKASSPWEHSGDRLTTLPGSRQEEPHHREEPRRPHRTRRQSFSSPGLWRRQVLLSRERQCRHEPAQCRLHRSRRMHPARQSHRR